MDAPPAINDDPAVPLAMTMNDDDTGELYFRSRKRKSWLEPQQSTDRSPNKAKKKLHTVTSNMTTNSPFRQRTFVASGVMVGYVCVGAACMAKVVARGLNTTVCGVLLTVLHINEPHNKNHRTVFSS